LKIERNLGRNLLQIRYRRPSEGSSAAPILAHGINVKKGAVLFISKLAVGKAPVFERLGQGVSIGYRRSDSLFMQPANRAPNSDCWSKPWL